MFDIGFSELLVIGVVALIVIGPQKLPRVARTAGHLLGRLQRYVADVKADINREIELDELRKMRDSMQQAANEMQSTVDAELSKTADELNRAAQGAEPAAPDKAAEAAPRAEAAKAHDEPKVEEPKAVEHKSAGLGG
jgi:sec-independent protein translocase protein TatB